MKTLPVNPYLLNIVNYFHELRGGPHYKGGIRVRICEMYNIDEDEYPNWLRQFGFKVPIENDRLEFSHNFPDEKLLLFILRWS